MIDNEIVEKIKKLLRIKRGGSVAEIETALSLAQKLACKHGIDINSIDENEPAKEPVTHDNGAILNRLQLECKFAALIVQRFFNVNVFSNGHGLTFIGTKTDIAIAQYVYNFLVKHFRREWKLKRGRLRNRQAFMHGIYQGLWNKLAWYEPDLTEKEGLILTGNKLQRENYKNENFPGLKNRSVKPDHNANAAFHAGYVSGKNTNINPAIKEDKKVNLLNE